MSGVQQALRRGAFWAATQTVGEAAFQMAIWLILSRWLAPSDFGLVALANVALSLLAVVSGQSLGTALVQRADLTPAHRDAAFVAQLGLSIVVVALALLAASAAAPMLGARESVPLLRALVPVLIVRSLALVPEAEIIRELGFKAIAGRQLASAIAGGIVGIGLAMLGAGPWSLVAQQWVSALTSLILLWLTVKWRPGRKASWAAGKQLWDFYGPYWGVDWLNLWKSRSDHYIVGALMGPAALGFYSLAHRVLDVATTCFVSILGRICMPIFSRNQDRPGELRDGYLVALRWTCFGALPMAIILGVLAPQLVPVVFGPNWAPAGAVLRWLAPVLACRPFFQLHAALLLACGRSRVRFWLILAQTVISVGLYLAWADFGVIGIAAAFTAGVALIIPVNIGIALQLMELRCGTAFQAIAPAGAGSLLVFGGLVIAQSAGIDFSSLGRLMAAGLTAGAVYIVFVIAMDSSIRGTLRGALARSLPTADVGT